ncbi:ion transporter [Photobacterium sanguinicancri]|uniref:ion transporter n=1 Tax=Photobacterium sanguinicancri TaxID=875932 RepID=UPI000AFDE7DC|nr:ion transporter [Photobacterium sanguinicancri]
MLPIIKMQINNIFTSPKISSSVIALSVIVIFIGSFTKPETIDFFHWLITIFFVLESLFKIHENSWKGYIKSNGNKFDLIVVVLCVLLLLTPSTNIESVAYLRLFRVLSLIRVMKLVPNSESIFKGLMRAISASRAIIALLAVMLIIFSMTGYSLFSNYLPEYFGDPLSSMNTIFTIFTVENWGAIPEAAKTLGDDNIFYAVNSFVIIVLVLGGFLALSLANAVFVDEMVTDNNEDIKADLAQLKQDNLELRKLILELKNDL